MSRIRLQLQTTKLLNYLKSSSVNKTLLVKHVSEEL